jgi:hypothetical protein
MSYAEHNSPKALQKDEKFRARRTDPANPSSNRIYRKIGHAPAGDRVDCSFVEGGGS